MTFSNPGSSLYAGCLAGLLARRRLRVGLLGALLAAVAACHPSGTGGNGGGGSSSTSASSSGGAGGAGGSTASTSSASSVGIGGVGGSTSTGVGGAGGSTASASSSSSGSGGGAPTVLWNKRFGDSASQSLGQMIADGAGNLWITGQYAGTIDFGGGPLSAGPPGSHAVYLAKLDASGNHLASWSFDTGNAAQTGMGIAVDGAGNLAVAGVFKKAFAFKGSLVSPTPNASESYFVAKLSPSGDLLWSKVLGQSMPPALGAGALFVGVDAAGNVVLHGSVDGPGGGQLILGGMAVVQQVSGPKMFLARYDTSGNYLASSIFTGNGTATGLFVGAGGDVLVSAFNTLNIDFGSGVDAPGSNTSIVARFTPALKAVWDKVGPWTGAAGVAGAFDSAGDALVAGGFAGTAEFGAGPVVSQGTDAYAAKLDALGNHLYSHTFGGTGNQSAGSVAVDTAGTLLLGGTFYESIDLGGGSFTAANEDGFLARFDGAGNHLYSQAIKGGAIGGVDVAPGPQNSVYAGGVFYLSVDLGTGPLVTSGINGDQDIFLARIALP